MRCRVRNAGDHDLQDEVQALRDICRHQEMELDSLSKHNEKLRSELDSRQEAVDELRNRVMFLEGQIEAYKYSLNCIR